MKSTSTTESCKNTLSLGEVLNTKWVILEFIDKGGMGEVYRAHQTNLNRDVAIKIISQEWFESIDEDDKESETVLHRFRREVQAMAQISHPNVLQVFDYDSITVKKCDQMIPVEYIAMEYIPGGSLRATMSDEGFFPDESAIKSWISKYFMPVLAGIKALHDIGIVHRDLKPENILMDHDTPKIADFGLARSSRLRPVTQSMDIKGSPHYMSPEHFFDFKRADQKADIYSLGKILFEAVEGKIKSGIMPFKSARLAKIETPFFQQLDDIIQRATAESRDERTKSVQDLRRQIEQVVGALEIQQQAEDSTKEERASFLLRPKWIWSGVVVAILSVLLMTIWHFMGEPGWDLTKGGFSRDSGVHESQSKFDNAEVNANRDAVASSTVSEYIGKQHLLSGGAFIVPASASGIKQQTVQVEPFYMDEFFVTNQQFVDFLNSSLARISLENRVVKGDGANWCLLGEVHAGYEPIVYGNNEFQISDPAYASSPVLRVTGYGASAFAKFFGRRLPIEVELLYAMSKGANSHQLNAGESDRIFSEAPMGSMMGKWPMEKENGELRPSDQKPNTSNESIVQKLTLPAVLYNPNTIGIRGLNDGIGEWALKSLNELSKDQTQRSQYAVVGGMEGAPQEENFLPEVVVRHPWEGFEEVGFRTVTSTTGEKVD